MDMREVLEAMRLNGLHDEAAAVGIVMQQRAELLEALKGVHKSLGHMMHPNQKAAVVASITKAEAAE